MFRQQEKTDLHEYLFIFLDNTIDKNAKNIFCEVIRHQIKLYFLCKNDVNFLYNPYLFN